MPSTSNQACKKKARPCAHYNIFIKVTQRYINPRPQLKAKCQEVSLVAAINKPVSSESRACSTIVQIPSEVDLSPKHTLVQILSLPKRVLKSEGRWGTKTPRRSKWSLVVCYQSTVGRQSSDLQRPRSVGIYLRMTEPATHLLDLRSGTTSCFHFKSTLHL